MSKTVAQIFATNPTTVVADTDLYYLVQSPYIPGSDAAISGLSLKAAFGTGGTINPGLINQLGYYAASGSTISGLATANNGVLITSAGGVPSISSTLPGAVQSNITALGTITSIGSPLGSSFGGTGINNGTSTITIGGSVSFVGAFTFAGTLTGNTAVTFPTSGTLATTSQLPTPSALTKTDDTNVTLTLGGSPTVALLAATSLTLGWTGTLSGTRGGTGVNNGASTITLGASFTTSGAFAVTQTYTGITNVTFPTSGTLATTSQLLTSPLTTKGDIWTWTTTNARLPVATGDGKVLQVSSGAATGLAYSTPTYPSASGSAGQILRSDGTNNLYTTTTYPNTNAINTLLYASAANVMSALATANSGVLITDGSGVPSIATQIVASNLPSGTMFNFQQGQLTTPVTTTSTTFVDATGLSVAITPTSSSNKVLVRATVQVGTSLTEITLQLVRGSTAIGIGTSVGSRQACSANTFSVNTNLMTSVTMEWLDSPATTSATTYKVQFLAGAANTVAINSSITDTNSATFPRTASTISVCEIRA